MQNKIVHSLLQKKGETSLWEFLSQTLSDSELNSLLLAIFEKRAKNIPASSLLRNYSTNRFVGPVDLDPVRFAEIELVLMRAIRQRGFEIKMFSPVTVLGTSAALAPVDQKNVLTALRNTEVVSDITNVLALEIAQQRRQKRGEVLQMSALHRHIRGQRFDIEGFTPHFKILSLVTAGRDKGNYRFEIEEIVKHIQLYQTLLNQIFGVEEKDIDVEFKLLGQIVKQEEKIRAQLAHLDLSITFKQELETEQNDYYKDLRFKMRIKKGTQFIEIIDGGSVDWTRQLLADKKERLITSGLGLEFVYRILDMENRIVS